MSWPDESAFLTWYLHRSFPFSHLCSSVDVPMSQHDMLTVVRNALAAKQTTAADALDLSMADPVTDVIATLFTIRLDRADLYHVLDNLCAYLRKAKDPLPAEVSLCLCVCVRACARVWVWICLFFFDC